jgi:predicted RNA binding protein YcfA (HicA-like mRNA interferase family)
MPRLPKFTGKKLVRVLRKNRFVLDHITGSHFVFRHPETGRRVIIPVHHKELPPGTLLSILKQAGLSRDDLAEK